MPLPERTLSFGCCPAMGPRRDGSACALVLDCHDVWPVLAELALV
jgi:hypothetical protein